MIASGVFSSWAAEAKASRQQLQCSWLTGSGVGFTGDIFAGGMGITPFRYPGGKGKSVASLG